jgi:PST family polysaccharide transporter
MRLTLSPARRDALWLYVSLVARYAAPLLLVPFYGRVLGAQTYGQLLSAMALSQAVWVFVEWGLPVLGLRAVAQSSGEAERGLILSSHLRARLKLALGLLPLVVVLIWASPVLRADPLLAAACALLGAANACNLTWFFQGVSRLRLAAVFELAGLLVVTLFILSVVRGPDQVLWIPAAYLVVSGLSFGFQWRVARQHTQAVPPAQRQSWRDLSTIRESAVLFAYRGFVMLLGPASVMVVGYAAPPQQATLFAVAERLSSLVMATLQPLHQVLQPQVHRQFGAAMRDTTSASFEAARALVSRYLARITGLIVVVTALAIALAGALIPVVLGPGFTEAVPAFRAMCAAVGLGGVAMAVISYVLLPLRRDRTVAMMSVMHLGVAMLAVTAGSAWAGSVGGGLGRALASVGFLAAAAIAYRRFRQMKGLAQSPQH